MKKGEDEARLAELRRFFDPETIVEKAGNESGRGARGSECMSCGEVNCVCPCEECDGDGIQFAEDSASFDDLNDDPEALIPCSRCAGTGLARNYVWA